MCVMQQTDIENGSWWDTITHQAWNVNWRKACMHTHTMQPCVELYRSDCGGYGCVVLDCFKLSEESSFWGSQKMTPPLFMVPLQAHSEPDKDSHSYNGRRNKKRAVEFNGNCLCWWLLAYFRWVSTCSILLIYKLLQRQNCFHHTRQRFLKGGNRDIDWM